MLKLIQSNRTEVLVARLATRLSQQVAMGVSALAPHTVLVQSQGMRQWLTIELARRNGIAANLATPMPAAFLWQLCQRVMQSDASRDSAFDKLAMSWHIMALLPELLQQGECESLRLYLAEHRHEQLQRYQLSYRIADVFDQYLVYRPDWLLAWERGNDTALEPAQRWQAVLWRAMLARITQRGPRSHRADIHREVQQRLLAGDYQGDAIPAYIAIFGVSSLPPQQMDLFIALGQQTTVELYAMNPCAQYWGDIVSEKSRSRRRASSLGDPSASSTQFLQVGNPLLASFGGQGRDFFDLLLERDISSDDHFVQVEPDTLLRLLQDDILNLHSRTDSSTEALPKFVIGTDDHSVQIHSCHSPMREVEVLHDQLLAMLGADSSLRLRDIIVMVPDISAYAPTIHAVFSQPRHGTALRYSISDRSLVDETPVLRAFLALIELPQSRFTAPEIIDLLQTPAIADQFGFSGADLARVRHWLAGSGIRWGWNAHHKQEFGLPPSEANTWQFGLDRLLLGYAMPAAAGLFNGTLADDEVDSGSAELLGRTIQVLDLLWSWRLRLQRDYSWREWQLLLRQCVTDFFAPDNEETMVLEQFLQNLDSETSGLAIDELAEPITPILLQNLLQQRLQQPGDNFGFLAGGINFCTLMPMRSIPFKVVCLLGMNDQQFPRSQSVPSFDLVARELPRRGDRNRRNDDRYQMLEAMLAARDRLYISYVGHDVRDNSAKLASVLVSELVDYCERVARVEGEFDAAPEMARRRVLQRLLTAHHLQPFDERYFSSQAPRWFSFAGEYYNAAVQRSSRSASWSGQSVPLVEPPSGRLRLDSLIAFVANSCRTFLQQRLGIYMDLTDDEVSDTEVLQLDGLDRYQLTLDAQRLQLEGASETQWMQLCAAAGRAPQGGPGELALASLWSDGNRVMKAVQPWLVDEPDSISLDLELGGFQLEGELGPIHDNCMVSWRPGKFRQRQLLQHWLRHVLANAARAPVTSRLFDAEHAYCFAPIPTAEATAWLLRLLAWYQLGLQRALPLLPETAWKWLEVMAKSDDEAQAWRQAEACWSPVSDYARGEGQDASISRCFSFEELRDNEFIRIARELVEPARLALEVMR
jgi:exodeoxyribonuclease V gamma subunit